MLYYLKGFLAPIPGIGIPIPGIGIPINPAIVNSFLCKEIEIQLGWPRGLLAELAIQKSQKIQFNCNFPMIRGFQRFYSLQNEVKSGMFLSRKRQISHIIMKLRPNTLFSQQVHNLSLSTLKLLEYVLIKLIFYVFNIM